MRGRLTELRPATLADRPMIYEWLARSDVTGSMMGPPKYPDAPIPTWEEFTQDFTDGSFDDRGPDEGRSYLIMVGGDPVGQINHGPVDRARRRVEVDIWMSGEVNCGKGYGPDALETMSDFLFETLGITEIVIRPSTRNPRAVRAYEKAGFVRVDWSAAKVEAELGKGDYDDEVVLVKRREGPANS